MIPPPRAGVERAGGRWHSPPSPLSANLSRGGGQGRLGLGAGLRWVRSEGTVVASLGDNRPISDIQACLVADDPASVVGGRGQVNGQNGRPAVCRS